MLRFSGFELDFQRAELRGPGGNAIKLRPKTFTMLYVFATNPGRVLSKQELMAAVWPKVHVGEDGLFQCIREIRSALGDNERQLVKSISGRGYIFDAEVSTAAPATEQAAAAVADEVAGSADRPIIAVAEPGLAAASAARPRFRLHAFATLPIVILLAALFGAGLVFAVPTLAPRFFTTAPPVVIVAPITVTAGDPQAKEVATGVADLLTDGLAKIRNIRVQAPDSTSTPGGAAQVSVSVSASSMPADYVVRGNLQKAPHAWNMEAQLIRARTGEVLWSTSFSVVSDTAAVTIQEARLAAGVGYPTALKINALLHTRLPSAASKVVIEQSDAFINQTSRERFTAAQHMLEKAVAQHPNDVDLNAALAAQLLRGIQTDWYTPAEAAKAEARAKIMLEHALEQAPNYIPALDGYCRFLTATNHFVESLVACANALNFDPWNGLVMFQIGLSQLQLGRFTDALDTFQRADTFDTPQVSRWTWLLGAGLALVVLDRDQEALTWLQRSRDITAGTGRTDMLIAAADQSLGRFADARAAMARGMALRPGSSADNVGLPTRNASPLYLARSAAIKQLMVAAGLPPH
jgi:DNA-binding winged helix-turn-helix (wHTH) protein/TolB-like protein/Tfp pilus assembly protein PilF